MGEQTDLKQELAAAIRPFLRHPSHEWLMGASIEAAERVLFELDNQPQPDWADLRDMARNAGWTAGTDKPVPSALKLPAWIWGRRERGWLNNDHGWIRAETMIDGRWRIDVIGPAPHPLRSVSLVAPSPAEILTAARLVGLIGGTS